MTKTKKLLTYPISWVLLSFYVMLTTYDMFLCAFIGYSIPVVVLFIVLMICFNIRTIQTVKASFIVFLLPIVICLICFPQELYWGLIFRLDIFFLLFSIAYVLTMIGQIIRKMIGFLMVRYGSSRKSC